MGERKAIHCADPANQSVQLTIWRPKGRKDTPLTINTISHTLWGVLKGNFWADTGLSLGSLNVGANCICVGRSRLSPYPNVARGGKILAGNAPGPLLIVSRPRNLQDNSPLP